MLRVHLNQRNWELGGIQRSAYEAAHSPDSSLGITQANIDRYINRPMTTVDPLEYVFALLGDVRGRTVLDFGCGSGDGARTAYVLWQQTLPQQAFVKTLGREKLHRSTSRK